MKIRFAEIKDSSKILDIYAQYIDTPITFEYDLPGEEEFTARMRHIMSEYPYLVCEDEGRIVGYAYAHRHMERAAYQWGAELSVYLDQTYTAKGLGRKLYTILIEILIRQGVKTVYGGVTLPNEKSEKLHESLGFERLGTYHNAGYKDGKWHDVVWFEKEIAACDQDPALFQPFPNLHIQNADNLLQNSNPHPK